MVHHSSPDPMITLGGRLISMVGVTLLSQVVILVTDQPNGLVRTYMLSKNIRRMDAGGDIYGSSNYDYTGSSCH